MTASDPTSSSRARARATAAIDGPLVFAIALVLSLVISWRPLQLTMHGQADAVTTGIRYLIGLALAWAATLGFAHLVRHFATESVAAEARRRAASLPQRRADDPGFTGDAPDERPAEVSADER